MGTLHVRLLVEFTAPSVARVTTTVRFTLVVEVPLPVTPGGKLKVNVIDELVPTPLPVL
jgi:hypothetical protein